jgi:hypothetical protein
MSHATKETRPVMDEPDTEDGSGKKAHAGTA